MRILIPFLLSLPVLAQIDLREATVSGAGLGGPSQKALQMLVEEVETRTRIHSIFQSISEPGARE